MNFFFIVLVFLLLNSTVIIFLVFPNTKIATYTNLVWAYQFGMYTYVFTTNTQTLISRATGPAAPFSDFSLPPMPLFAVTVVLVVGMDPPITPTLPTNGLSSSSALTLPAPLPAPLHLPIPPFCPAP
jgi:hypothetical protein